MFRYDQAILHAKLFRIMSSRPAKVGRYSYWAQRGISGLLHTRDAGRMRSSPSPGEKT